MLLHEVFIRSVSQESLDEIKTRLLSLSLSMIVKKEREERVILVVNSSPSHRQSFVKSISLQNMYPFKEKEVIRHSLREEPQYLQIITNDSWFEEKKVKITTKRRSNVYHKKSVRFKTNKHHWEVLFFYSQSITQTSTSISLNGFDKRKTVKTCKSWVK